MVGAINTAAALGSFVSTVGFGYLVERFGSYDLPFVSMACLLLFGSWLWTSVDPADVFN